MSEAGLVPWLPDATLLLALYLTLGLFRFSIQSSGFLLWCLATNLMLDPSKKKVESLVRLFIS